jgi:hypothetical protein
MSEWIENTTGIVPEGVVRGTLVDVRYHNKQENFGVSALTRSWNADHIRGSFPAAAREWSIEGHAGDITHYRICPTS